MIKLNKKSGFTLLELIVVVIIVAVLASLALPRFFRTIEASRAAEALQNLSALRQAVIRCSMRQASTATVAATCGAATFANLDIENPNNANPRLFTYNFSVPPAIPAGGNQGDVTFTLRAQREYTPGAPSATDFITLTAAGARTGNGVYAGIQ